MRNLIFISFIYVNCWFCVEYFAEMIENRENKQTFCISVLLDFRLLLLGCKLLLLGSLVLLLCCKLSLLNSRLVMLDCRLVGYNVDFYC